MWRSWATGLAAAAMAAGPASAQTGDAAAPGTTTQAPAPNAVEGVTVSARRPTHVSGVTVTASVTCPRIDPQRYPTAAAPRVVDSWPRPNAAVTPGYIFVRLSFDQPMSCFSEVSTEGGGDDPCASEGVWETPERRIWLMQCKLEPQTGYTFQFRRYDGRGFVGLSGREAPPYRLAFSTTGAPPVTSLDAARAADPGASAAGAVKAYVTCVDRRDATDGDDCKRERVTPPADTTPPQ